MNKEQLLEWLKVEIKAAENAYKYAKRWGVGPDLNYSQGMKKAFSMAEQKVKELSE